MNDAPVQRPKWQKYLLLCIGLAAAGLLYYRFGCPVYYFTGISCPGCGVSRACGALLHLDIAGAFYYHPLFWLGPVLAVVVLVRRGPLARPRVRNAVLVGIALCFIAVYILRMFVFKIPLLAPVSSPFLRDMRRLLDLLQIM